jgi:hypothetical protein
LSFSDLVRAAYRIAALPTSAARRSALSAIPPEYQDLVRETATSARAVCLHWMSKPPATIPPAVLSEIKTLFPDWERGTK